MIRQSNHTYLTCRKQHPIALSALLAGIPPNSTAKNGRGTRPWWQIGNLPPLGRWQERPEPT